MERNSLELHILPHVTFITDIITGIHNVYLCFSNILDSKC